MKSFLFTVIALVFMTMDAFAQYARLPQDIKLPTQKVFDVTQYVDAPTASATAIITGAAGATSATPVTITTGFSQPTIPRNLSIIPTGTTADVAAGNVTVVGRDATGKVISEDFAFLANASTATVGNKAFARITSITFPGEDSPFGATWNVGTGDKLGLKRCLDGAGYSIAGLVDGAALTGNVVVANATDVSQNTFTPNPVANGARDFTVLFIQNYRCQ